VSVENFWLTVMLVPDRVVIVADPGAVAKMPEEKLAPSTLIAPLR
jgi:hypothetical protein